MNDEQVRDHIAALIRERDGYLKAGLTDRAAEVDLELRKWGADSKPPVKRATRRDAAC